MSQTWHKRTAFGVGTLIAVSFFAACGGRVPEGNEQGGASGGELGHSGSGGRDTTAGGSPAESGRGGSFSVDGGRVGAGGAVGDGGLGSSGGAGPQGGSGGSGCVYDGKIFPVGATFPGDDTCSSCTCEATGVQCTYVPCTACASLQGSYDQALEDALKCDPTLNVEQCTTRITIGLVCACGGFANGANAEAITRLQAVEETYSNICVRPDDVACGACLEPTRADCSPAGRCEQRAGNSCVIGGKEYPDGANGIPDGTGCNTCSCVDGDLVCSQRACPIECPEGTAFGTQCTQCGPTDECLNLEQGCYPKCVDNECAKPGEVCLGGICLTGVCG